MRNRRSHSVTGRPFALVLALLVPLMLPAPVSAQKPVQPPHADSLAAISSRGHTLAEYDYAAWHATDAVMALRPSEGEFDMYFALPDGARWRVVFGRLTARRDTFLLAYDARAMESRPDSFEVLASHPARPTTGHYLRAARALDTARKTFVASERPRRPYNAIALHTQHGEWLVYIIPAQTRADVFPLGGDVRYRITGDGLTILETRRMHNTIIEFGPASRTAGEEMKFGMHTAVVDNMPEDTDVFHVMVREPSVPQLIATDAFVYQVNPSGRIQLLGTREEFMKP